MIEARRARPGIDAARETGADDSGGCASASESLAEVVMILDRACDELFAVVPFLGDQATGARVNATVDEVVDALRGLRAEADDLRRVIAIAERSRGGP
ncbi:MAG: hypothetical protein ABR500_09850 [Dermatophilaceae bacterium]|nr:hypothetical protein [Intrasporangiaceae bacterium]